MGGLAVGDGTRDRTGVGGCGRGSGTAADAGCAIDSELCAPASSPPDVVGADSTSSSLCPSSEDNDEGKRIGLSITVIHLAMGDM